MKTEKAVPIFLGILLVLAVIYAVVTSTKEQPELIKEFDFSNQEMDLKVTFTDKQTIQKRFGEVNQLDSDDVPPVRAFATLRYTLSECDIYVPPVKYQNDRDAMETLGHELLHCIYGRWHPGNEYHST